MAWCKKCDAPIAEGKNYCPVHYPEAIAAYRKKLARYEQKHRQWLRFSPEEKRHADRQAEQASTSRYAVFSGLLLGALVCYRVAQSYHIDPLGGLSIMAGSLLVCTVLGLIRSLLGRLTRAALMAVVYFMLLVAIIWLGAGFSRWLSENHSALCIGAAPLAFLLSLLAEFLGYHHASARPAKPTGPSPGDPP